MRMTMKIHPILAGLVVVVVVVVLGVSAVAAAIDPNDWKPEWTHPLRVGDSVPDVTFATRVRIESDEENPFDWKCTSEYMHACL